MNERFKTITAVFTVIEKDGKVLLLRRANTGWLDGYFDLPSGHLEPEESIKEATVRELKEETGLEVKPDDARLINIYQNYHSPERPYIGFIFKADSWTGEPKICEPDKCDEMGFFSLNELPRTTPYVRLALGNLASRDVTFSFFGPGSIGS